jgi:Flp pilus assembly protein TadD
VRAAQGRHDDAISAFGQALHVEPDNPDLHNELGIALARRRRFDDAATSYRHALRLQPGHPDAHNNLGNALRNLGRLDEAVACFREALRLRPHYPEAYNNLGIALTRQGKFDEAFGSYRQALRLRPSYAEAHNNLGLAHAARGKHEPAVLCYQQALCLKADYLDAAANLGESLTHLGRHAEAVATFEQAVKARPADARLRKMLGIALARSERLDDAVASYREAIRLRPAYPEAYNDLAIALARQGRHAEAVECYRKAIEYRPRYAEAHNNMGNALRNLGHFDESLVCYRNALEIKPAYADAHNNRGIAFAELGRFDEAVASYTECIRLRPNHVDAHMNRALTWLRKGDFAQGWAEYEWRWRKRSLTSRPLHMPQWNGFPLKGRRLLVFPEQGNGDVIQFVRYARLLKEQGATVILECPERLVKLLARCPHIDHLVPQGQPLPDYDVYAPLLTLPGFLDTAPETVPAQVPYVYADPDLVERWRGELGAVRAFKVGINWQGNPKYAGDRHRSIPLARFEALARVPGVRLYSLQKNHGSEQLAELAGKFPVEDLGSRLDETTGPFLDTAAVLKNLDLFITSDTAVAHLAGALGVPVWVALSTTADWRWMTERDDNPWYPTMRLFRQSKHMDWAPVFERMSAELGHLVPRSARTPSILAEVAEGELIDRSPQLR